MKLPSILTALTLSACAATSDQPARDPSLGPPPGPSVGYLIASDLNGATILGPPPAVDSPHGRADRTVFDETRILKDSPRWKTAIQDNDLWSGGALSRFSCALGKEIDEKRTPTAYKILHKIENDVRTLGSPAKAFYGRKRPLIGNDKPICVPREPWMETNASYPSGHAMTVWAWALILTETAPERGTALLTLGRDSGESRVVCGVHFPSDVEAGRTLASAMVARLHANPEFNADLAKAKREIAATRAAPKNCPAA